MIGFVKKEAVFVIALLFALLTTFFNPPSGEYIEAIDFRTLGLLFSLMGISEGLKESGFFSSCSSLLLRKSRNMKMLSMLLVLMVFVLSMLFTNDVSLIMFVPFSIMLLEKEGADERYIARLVTLETISANLGSMTTPVGNPQNIYLCSVYQIEAGDFFAAILPYSALSLILVLASSYFFLKSEEKLMSTDEGRCKAGAKSYVYIFLLFLALLTVFNLISWIILVVTELVIMLVMDRKIIKRIDYILLLTFICFFIFSANIREIDGVASLISVPMERNGMLTGALTSQVISNVPSAIFLSAFTDNYRDLLIGTNLGGLGTPIASLASLISLKLYFKRKTVRKGYYMTFFLILNFLLLALLLSIAVFLNR